jgi:polysaccharide deacetylase 2 family uncharacterized protein YibQ
MDDYREGRRAIRARDEARNARDEAEQENERLRRQLAGAVDLAERYGEAIIAISAALPNVNRVRAIIASLDTDGGQ